MGKPPTVTEQLMANRAAKRASYSTETPGDVLLEAMIEWDPGRNEYISARDGNRDPATAVTLDGTFDLDAIARAFLHKVMASG
jgi:hypothetical protein